MPRLVRIGNACCLADNLEPGTSDKQTHCWACAKPLDSVSPDERRRCVGCNTAVYCSQKCTFKDYQLHKTFCVDGSFTGVKEIHRVVRDAN